MSFADNIDTYSAIKYNNTPRIENICRISCFRAGWSFLSRDGIYNRNTMLFIQFSFGTRPQEVQNMFTNSTKRSMIVQQVFFSYNIKNSKII